jgi:2-hydroxycyclohexanecarboxyl-CoA dehydrogenase
MLKDLTDGAALVIGGGSGMGRLAALGLAERKAPVAVADRNGASARAVAAEIGKAGGRAEAYELDIAKSAQVNSVVAQVSRALGPVAYLANLAGVYDVRAVEAITDENWAEMLQIHAAGTFYAVRAVLPAMMERKMGAIVTTSSVQGVRGQPNGAHYAAAKGAIMSFTKSVAREKAHLNIRANVVAPGPLDTPFFRRDRPLADIEATKTALSKVIPRGHIGVAEDVAPTIVFLLGPEASHITGQVININGGEVMP